MMDLDAKTKTLTINLTKKMFNVEQANGLTKKQKEKLKAILKDEVKMVKDHFKKDGWDLDFECIKSDIIYELIGADFFGIVAAEILTAMKGKVQLKHTNKFMLTDPNHQPIYMNKKTGKLIVCESSQLSNKYERLEYTYIGRL